MSIRGEFYDPETVASMGLAFDEAWRDVAAITLIEPKANSESLRNLMANRIMVGVAEGVHHASELKILALNAVDWWSLVTADETTGRRHI
jgi:hypothetical protein